jgi:hypothetical protein
MMMIVDERRRGVALGAAGYLTKPIDRERLIEAVSRLRVADKPGTVLVVEDSPGQPFWFMAPQSMAWEWHRGCRSPAPNCAPN